MSAGYVKAGSSVVAFCLELQYLFFYCEAHNEGCKCTVRSFLHC